MLWRPRLRPIWEVGHFRSSWVSGFKFRVIVNPRKLEHGFRMMGARIPSTYLLYLKGMRIRMFQLFGFYYISIKPASLELHSILLRDYKS